MEIFNKITELLKSQNVNFRTVEHQAEGRCDVISKIRGNDLCQALKALVIMAKLNKKDRKYFLAVVPGDKSLDMTAIKDYSQAHDGVMFAPIDRASALTECNIGAVPPFTFNQDLHLIVDPSIKLNKEVVFNAGVLDHSIFISIEDYIKTANPTFVDIIKK